MAAAGWSSGKHLGRRLVPVPVRWERARFARGGVAMDPLRLRQSVTRVARARLTRRAALASTSAGLASALLGRLDRTTRVAPAQAATPPATTVSADDLPPNVPAWTRTPGGWVSPYGQRAPAEAGVVRLSDPLGTPYPLVSFSPLADIRGAITPNALFHEIAFGGIPSID